MTVIANEEKKMDGAAKTYLEMYEEYINGYKQYKLEKAAVSIEAVQIESFEETAN